MLRSALSGTSEMLTDIASHRGPFSGSRADTPAGSGTPAIVDPLQRSDLRTKAESWILAGMRLRIAAQMSAHHAHQITSTGLNSANRIIVRMTGKNKDRVDDAWASHRHVAHLAAAVVDVAQREGDDLDAEALALPNAFSGIVDEFPAEVFVHALAVEKFGLVTKIPRSRDTHLDSLMTWRNGLAIIAPAIESFLVRLTPAQLSAAESEA